MDSKSKSLRCQIGITVLGSLTFIFFLATADLVREKCWFSLYKFYSGYIFAFIIAFAGFVFAGIIKGERRRFIASHPFVRYFSYLSLTVIMLFGTASLFVEIFGNTDWRYNIGSLLGSVVVAIGLIPVIDTIDNAKP